VKQSKNIFNHNHRQRPGRGDKISRLTKMFSGLFTGHLSIQRAQIQSYAYRSSSLIHRIYNRFAVTKIRSSAIHKPQDDRAYFFANQSGVTVETFLLS
jgi:hypothetical protein